MSIVYQETGLS